MQKIIQFTISNLKRVLTYLESKILLNQVDKEGVLNSLAPKILIDDEELKKVNPYLSNLKKAINTESINNIALTGSYGSGKSTILKTFQHHNRRFKYLNISLASFKDNKDESEEKEFERKLEISILQQIFYHVKPSVIPDSRFKRIVNLTTSKLLIQTLFLLLWVLSAIILFKFDFVNKLNPLNWSSKLKFDWLSISLILIFLIGIGLFVKSIIRLFSNSKISKLNIKGEVELGEAIDKSVFNQHLEEILYFFERTEFNVVIIEDVDRFDSTDIFTKLREINILINNSNLISRKVSFVYAIKDEMFTDKNDRVKFFEFIIPVIPFINPSNAGEQLTKLINAANLQGVLSSEFTEDVITFIDDIDMRLLINIFHEYQLYSENLSKDLEQDNLFAMIVYKNMFPHDFGELPKRNGNLYKILSNKATYVESLIKNINSLIDNIDSEIEIIESEVEKPIKELRAVYINGLIFNLDRFYSFFINENVSVIDILEDANFFELKKSDDVVYIKYLPSPYYGGDFRVSGSTHSNVSFSSIEKEISSLTYNQREKNLLDKANGQVNNLKKDKEQLRNKIAEIESLSIEEIFEQVAIEEYLGPFKDNYLIRNLLLNGYINENYNDYISIFHGVNLTNDDFAFERKVKGGLATTFDYQLTKTENLIKGLSDKYFKREIILNYYLLDCLLENKLKYSIKFENFFKLLSTDNEKNFQFIISYIDRKQNGVGLFITNLVKYKNTLWAYIKNKSDIPDERIRELIKIIFEFADYQSLSKLEEKETLKQYFENCTDFFGFTSSFSKTKNLESFIKYNTLLINEMDTPNLGSTKLFDFVVKNNFYKINPCNVLLVVKQFEKDIDEASFNNANYSTLKKLNIPHLMEYVDCNLEYYVENVLLALPNNVNENEKALLELLNNDNINKGLKTDLLNHQSCQITSLNSIDGLDIKEMVIINNKLNPAWENIFDYYDCLEDKELNETLIDYLNIKNNSTSLSKIKLNTVKDRNEEFIKSFSQKIIYCNDLEFEAYVNLLKSIPYKYNTIEYEKLDKEKVEWMISNKFITTSTANFDGIKEAFPKLHIKLLEVYENEFVKKNTEFTLDANDWLLLFESKIFSVNNKLEIIKSIDDSVIIQNPKIAEIVCYLLPENEYTSLRYEVLDAMFTSNSSVKKRIALLNLHFDKLDDSQIQSLTEKLGDDYAKIFMKQHKPLFNKTDYHYNFFNKLKDKNLIIRFEDVDKTNEIKIYANY